MTTPYIFGTVEEAEAALTCRKREKRRKNLVLAGLALFTLLILAGFAVVWYASKATVDKPGVVSTVVPVATETPTATVPVPTSTKTGMALKPTSTPAAPAREALYLLWSPDSAWVDLLDAPDGDLVAKIPNGEHVFISERRQMGEQEWLKVAVGSQSGWIKARHAWEITADLPLTKVEHPDGAILRDQPAGEILAALPKGTPLYIIEIAGYAGQDWTHVSLLDDRGGWIASFLLSDLP